MSGKQTWILGGAALACVMALGAQAHAKSGGAVQELHAVEGANGKRVVAVSDNGVTFLDAQKGTAFRAFKSTRKALRGTTPDWFSLRDVDNNGTVDIVGVGQPSFLVTADAAPIYSLARGCDQFYVADFAADKSLDLLCRNGASMELRTYDGQELWKYKIQGIRLGACTFGDLNGDLKADIECEVVGKGAFLRLTGEGEELGRAFDQAALEGEEDDDNPGYADSQANYLKGQATFDLDGDGNADEWVKLDGNALVIGSKAKPQLARHEIGPIFSILAEDLDGDGKVDLVAGGDGKVFFFDAEGKLRATAASDPRQLKRQADAVLSGVNSNGLVTDDEAPVREALEKANKSLASCYEGNVKRDPFTRVGRTIWALTIDKKGKASKVERLHSDLNDKKVEGCLTKALQKVSFPAAKDPGANITVTLEFGFLDQ